jgi:hypothetical protein
VKLSEVPYPTEIESLLYGYGIVALKETAKTVPMQTEEVKFTFSKEVINC